MRNPPSQGPMTLEMPNTAPKRPWYLPALRGGEEVGDDGERRGEDARAAESLHGAEDDQLGHAARLAREDGPDEEKDDPDEHDDLAAVEVGKLPVDRDHRGGGQQVGGHHPGVQVQPVQVLEDLRHGRGHDGLVQRAEQQRDHDADQRDCSFSIRHGIHETRFSFLPESP